MNMKPIVFTSPLSNDIRAAKLTNPSISAEAALHAIILNCRLRSTCIAPHTTLFWVELYLHFQLSTTALSQPSFPFQRPKEKLQVYWEWDEFSYSQNPEVVVQVKEKKVYKFTLPRERVWGMALQQLNSIFVEIKFSHPRHGKARYWASFIT